MSTRSAGLPVFTTEPPYVISQPEARRRSIHNE
jgi:hypothetical protein